ncbi:transposon [Fagus crenata]
MDGCHLRSFLKRHILTTVSIDGNDGMYPIAFAICEGENKESWEWFLEKFMRDIDPHEKINWTFISDQQKVRLVPSLLRVVYEGNTRFCVRHLFANFKNKFKGKTLKELMWAATKETTKAGYEAKMKTIKNINNQVYEYLKGIKEVHWCRHAFSTMPKCDMLLNNVCEVFNSKLIMTRDKSLLTMYEMIRRYLITRIVKNKEAMNKVSGLLCPRIQDKLNINRVESRDCKTWFAGGNRFEVT